MPKLTYFISPFSAPMVKCIHSIPLGKAHVLGPGAYACSKPESCTCNVYGRTLREDVDPNFSHDPTDEIDKFLEQG